MGDLVRYDYVVQSLLPSLLINGWKNRLSREPAPGDLVMLSCAPMSEWHLSFFIEALGPSQYLLESVKTGNKCRWSNVGLYVIDCKEAGIGDRARWSDAQHGFAARFAKVRRKGDFYINIPELASFDGEDATVSFRTRHSFDKVRTSVVVQGWKRITQRDLLGLLREGEKAHEANRKKDAADG